MKWVDCRGGFVKFHPPPNKANTALFWSKTNVNTLKIGIPPPCGKSPTLKKLR